MSNLVGQNESLSRQQSIEQIGQAYRTLDNLLKLEKPNEKNIVIITTLTYAYKIYDNN